MSDSLEGIYYLVGPVNPETEKLEKNLKLLTKYVFRSENDDEIDQGLKQSGKAILIFSDARYALNFLEKYKFEAGKTKSVLVIDREGSYNLSAMQKFKAMDLGVYTPKKVPDLMNDIKRFLSDSEIPADEIEFAVNVGLKKV